MKKKTIIIVIIILLSALAILGLYQTFALGGDITKDSSGYYNVTVTDGTTVTVPAGSSKTVYYKLTNTNKGTVKYGVGYSGTNITVKYYTDTQDPVTGTVDYGKSKYIKLFVQNSGTTSSTATLSTILGYENGGDLIVPSGVTLVTESYIKPVNAATLITNLYNNSTKTPVTNNGITYNYDTTHNLMQDIGGNIRYYGASPDNYIYFNCSDYSNQTSDTCEKWRIIGVFDGKVKIMRNEVIGNYSWDNKNTSTGAESAYGKNDWTSARLMKLLNPGYESETYGGSLYYNSGSGTCYSGQNNATKTCDFTSIGIKNDTTRNLISDTLYYLGGHTSSPVYPNEIYEKERGTAVYSERPTTWPGKIALPYPSDYGYAADLGKCLNKQLNAYNESTCTSNNWMMSIFTSSYNWLLTPNSGSANFAWYVYSTGFVFSNIVAYSAYGVAPVLYLNSELAVKAGTGSSSEPYQLSTYLQSSNLTIQKDTGVISIYYKVNGSSTYSATTNSSVTLKVISGSNYYYYGTPHYGYKMDSCTKDSPCSGIMGDSDVNKTLSTTKLPTYTVTIKKTLDGGTATTLETVSVVSNGSYSTTYTGGPYYTFESVSCTNGQTATIKDVYTSFTNVVDGDFNITNVTNNTVCTIYISS